MPAGGGVTIAERESVNDLLNVLPITDRVYHDLRYTQPLVDEVLRRICRSFASGRVLVVAPNITLPAALRKLGYAVELWHVETGTLTEDLQPLVARRGPLDSILGLEEGERAFDVIVLPYVLESAAEHPAPLLARFSRLVKPGGQIIIASRHAGAFLNRLRAAAGKPLVPDQLLQKPGVSFSWPPLLPTRSFSEVELRRWSLEAGYGIRELTHVLGAEATMRTKPLSLPAWLMAEAGYRLMQTVPSLRDCLLATLEFHKVASRKPAPMTEASDQPFVSVIATVHEPDRAKRLVADLQEQSYSPQRYEVIVLHPAGAAFAELAAAEQQPAVRLIDCDDPVGPVAANRAVERATGEILAFTDDRCRVPSSWIDAGVAGLTGFTMGITGFVVADAGSSAAYLSLPGARSTDGHDGLFSAANSFFVRAAVTEAGGFAEGFQRAGAARWGWESQLAYRLQELGYRISFEDTLYLFRQFPIRGRRDWMKEEYRGAREIPQGLRELPRLGSRLLYRRFFLSKRTMYFNLMVASLSLALIRRRPLLAAGCVPWLASYAETLDAWPPREWKSSIRKLSAIGAHHSVWLGGLVVGSIKARKVVL
jgi:SAM-dependent methyltransferase